MDNSDHEDIPDDPGRALVETMLDSDGLRMVRDWMEAASAGVRASGVVTDAVPLLGWVSRMARGVGAVRDQLLMQKIERYLSALGDVEEDDRIRFAEQMDADPAERQKVGAQLMLCLDRMDDIEKPRILGLLWQAYLIGRIDKTMLGLLSKGLDKVHLVHLNLLYELRTRDKSVGNQLAMSVRRPKNRLVLNQVNLGERRQRRTLDDDGKDVARQDLVTAGFMTIDSRSGYGQGGIAYSVSSVGNTFVEVIHQAEIPEP